MRVLGREGRDWERERGEGFLGGARTGAESEAEGAAMMVSVDTFFTFLQRRKCIYLGN